MSQQPAPSTLIPIGAIIRAHGVRGGVRVRPYDEASEALGAAGRLFIAKKGAVPVEIRVEHASRDKESWLLALEGVADRDAAEALRGSELLLPRAELPAPAEDELYVADLVGCELVGLDGARLGRVLRVDNYGAQELLIVAPEGGGPEAMVPFVEPIVVAVDLDARRVTCDPPEGLFDLSTGGGAA